MKIKRLISIVVTATLLLTGCGTKLYTDGTAEGYSLIRDVEGVSFGVVTKVVGNATAVTNISESMNFEKNQTYLYKNGESEYFLFNISSLVLAVEKGTTFDIANAKDKQEAVLSNNVLGIWFDLPGKKLEYTDNTSNGVYKFIADVNGEVSVTSELFNDFTGKLVIISDGETEWSLFAGAVGDKISTLDKDVLETIEYMAASINKADAVEEVETAAVTLGGSQENIPEEKPAIIETKPLEDVASETTTEKKEEPTKESSEEEKTSEDISNTEATIEENDISSEEASSTEEIITVESEDTESEEADEAASESSTDIAVAESSESNDIEAASMEVSNEVNEDKEIKRGDSIELNNQKKTVRDDNTVYDSSIYNMLELGKWGYAEVKNKKEIGRVSVKVSELSTGKEAISLIKTACVTGVVPYSYYDAPAGCSWHVVKVTSKDGEGYVNVKLVGADGNKLNFRGIKYAERTYEIKASDTEKYIYYAVPNGCTEYVLEVGDGTVENSMNSAYYLVNDYE